MRRADWTWYRANAQAIEDELLLLLESSVLSRMFGEEIESFHKKKNPHLFDDESQIGSKNRAQKASETSKKKGRRGKAAAAKAAAKANQDAAELKRPEKEVYYAFGEVLQLAYRKEPLPVDRSRGGRTLFFASETAATPDPTAPNGFQYLPKVSERLLIWCSKIDPTNPVNPDAENVGFLRPDMIPMISLFREPPDLPEAKR